MRRIVSLDITAEEHPSCDEQTSLPEGEAMLVL